MKVTNKTNGFLLVNGLTLDSIKLNAKETVYIENPNLAKNHEYIINLFKTELEVDLTATKPEKVKVEKAVNDVKEDPKVKEKVEIKPEQDDQPKPKKSVKKEK